MNKTPLVTYNTYIGGVSSTISTAALLATKLDISVGAISNFTIVGSDIKCKITGSYEIPLNAFNANTSITYYKDEDGLVTLIGGYAFTSCTNLAEINFPSLVTISNLAFRFCSNLITLNDSFVNTTTIGNACFDGCSKITSLNFPVLGMQTIAVTALFRDMTLLTTVYAPNLQFNIDALSNSIFRNCTSLTTVTLTNLNVITDTMFYNCTSLVSISFPSVTKMNSDLTFYNCTSLTTITHPNLVTIIGNGYQIYGNTLVTSINWANVVNLSSLGGQSLGRFMLSTTVIDIRSATTLGSNTLNNNVFAGVTSGINITAGTFMQTNNSGGVEGDLVDAIARGCIVTYV
jgi:hypothetical protein